MIPLRLTGRISPDSYAGSGIETKPHGETNLTEILQTILYVLFIINSILFSGVLITIIALGGEMQKILKQYQDILGKSINTWSR